MLTPYVETVVRDSFGAHHTRLASSFATASGVHALVFILLIAMVRHGGHSGTVDLSRPIELPTLVWRVGPDGGGGGGGTQQPTPPGRLERPGTDHASVPGPPPAITPVSASHEPDPIDYVVIPVKPIGDALVSLPGVIDAPASQSASLGSGRGPGAGTGDGTGNGPGNGDGLGPGEKYGVGGGGPGVGGATMPVPIRTQKPRYSVPAMRARIQGIVIIECIVRPNGVCSDIRVARSLDPTFGLDEEAKRAVLEWRFKPGTRRGEPVPVPVRLELEFTIR